MHIRFYNLEWSEIFDDMGFKVAGHLRHKGANPSPLAGTVIKHHKTAWQPSGRVPAMCFLGTDTPNNQCLSPIKECFKGDFLI